VGGGTRSNFSYLNRSQFPWATLDCVTYAITPQFHVEDDRSVMENVRAQGATVTTARAIIGDGLPLVVGPITLRPRYNPYTNAFDATADPRQQEMFRAAWTVGSLAELVRSDVSELTYYQVLGADGICDVPNDRASGAPVIVPFPVYEVFSELGAVRHAAVWSSRAVPGDHLAALAIGAEVWATVFVANLRPDAVKVHLALPAGFSWSGGPLGQDRVSLDRRRVLELAPFGVVVLDGRLSSAWRSEL
jgi:hypothetical protein